MKEGSRYKVPFRRRRQGKTNYYLRRRLIVSGKKRVVIRRSTKHILAQLVESNVKGDITIVTAHSKELSKFGWSLSCANLPASYLVGLLLAKKITEKNLAADEYILDIGPTVMQYGTRTFAALKGVVDGGINVLHSEVVFPPEDRISGKHIDAYLAVVSENAAEGNLQFNRYKNKLKSGDVAKAFEATKKKIG